MERSRLEWARSAASRAAKRVGGTVWSFKFTLLCAGVACALAWAHAGWLLHVWLPELGRPVTGSAPTLVASGPADELLPRVRVVALTTGVVAAPVLAAEAWLFVCNALGSRSARRFALPFALATAGVVALGIVVVRAVPLPRMILFQRA